MRKLPFFFFFIFAVGALTLHFRLPQNNLVSAQIDDSKRQELLKRDASISPEKLEKVRREALGIRDSIINFVGTNYRKYKVKSNRFSDPGYTATGRKGQTSFNVTWQNGKTELMIVATFQFNLTEAAESHDLGLRSISMGEFFRGPEVFGKEAVLVKIVDFNKTQTNVGLHFVKGRINISGYIQNSFRKNSVNEKELVEFMQSIEPLFVAKADFDEL